MGRVVIGCLAVIGVISMFVLAVTVFGVYLVVNRHGRDTVAEVAPHTLLRLNLGGSIAETSGSDPIAIALSGGKAALRDLVDAIDSGAADPKVKGLIADLGRAHANAERRRGVESRHPASDDRIRSRRFSHAACGHERGRRSAQRDRVGRWERDAGSRAQHG